MEGWTLPAHDHRGPVGHHGLLAFRTVSPDAAALGPAMGTSGHCSRRLHAVDDTVDLHFVHVPRRAAVLEGARADERMDDAYVSRSADRAVDGVRGGRPAEGGLRSRSEARVRARAQ